MKKDVKAKFQELLEVPAELIKDSYRMTVVEGTNFLIENYKAIVEYDDCMVRLSCGIVLIGAELSVLEITSDEIIVGGKIKCVEFET